MYFRRRRRIWCPLFLLIVSIDAFVPQTTTSYSATRPLNAASRTWDQTRHKLIYYGEDDKEQHHQDPPKISTDKIKTKPMPVTGYNAKEICETYDRRPFQVGWRMNSVGLPLLGTLDTDINKNKKRILIQSTYFAGCV